MTDRIMYRTGAYDEIQVLPVIRVTKNRITYRITDNHGTHERTEERQTWVHAWHDSFDAARTHLAEQCLRKIASLQRQVADEQAHLDRIRAMEHP
jgi:hypothetical protein